MPTDPAGERVTNALFTVKHIAPMQDSRAHAFDMRGGCWCNPRDSYAEYGDADHPKLFIHNPQKPMVKGHGLELSHITMTADNNYTVSPP